MADGEIALWYEISGSWTITFYAFIDNIESFIQRILCTFVAQSDKSIWYNHQTTLSVVSFCRVIQVNQQRWETQSFDATYKKVQGVYAMALWVWHHNGQGGSLLWLVDAVSAYHLQLHQKIETGSTTVVRYFHQCKTNMLIHTPSKLAITLVFVPLVIFCACAPEY